MDKLLAQLQAFLDGTTAVDFALAPEERYGFIGRTVRRFTYGHLKRAQKAVVLRFLERVSGYSRQQLTRLVKRGAGLCHRECSTDSRCLVLFLVQDFISVNAAAPYALDLVYCCGTHHFANACVACCICPWDLSSALVGVEDSLSRRTTILQ
jgi:hypothetical protein